ncbi:MAG: GNA1162 family protein [Kiritimatiellia bacterium]|nr:CsgG/HfaB family protein [Lentisphaerota bacterium]
MERFDMRVHIKVLCMLLACGGLSLNQGCCCFGGRKDAPPVKYDSAPSISLTPECLNIKKVSVMPFRAASAIIGESVADMFVTEIIREQLYAVVERSQIDKVLTESEVALAGLTSSKAAEMGSMLGAEAVIIGTVDEYSMVQSHNMHFAAVGINARMIDCQTGKVLWSIDLARRANSTSITVSEHARGVVRTMVQALRTALANPKSIY